MNTRLLVAVMTAAVFAGGVFSQAQVASANGQLPLTAPRPATVAKKIKIVGTAFYKIVGKGVTPAPRVIVTLKDAEGNVVGQTETDMAGQYSLEASANTAYFVVSPFSRRGLSFTPAEKQIPAGQYTNVNFYAKLGK